MAWVAFDRAAKVIEEDPEASVVLKPIHDDIVAVRDEIHAEVLEKAWDATRQTFVQAYGSTKLDAAVLMMPLVGFLPATDERMVSTVEAIQRELMVDGYVQRYTTESGVDGLPPGEGAFLPCTFWLVDNLALMGREDEARELFERLAGLANDVGLLAEEYDPEAKRQLGNFPQAFTHVSLVNSACNLSGLRGPARRRAELGRGRRSDQARLTAVASQRPRWLGARSNSTAVPGSIVRVPSTSAVQWNGSTSPSASISPTPARGSKACTRPLLNGRSSRSAAR